MPFTVRAEMEEARKEIDPADFDQKDPLRPTEPKWADWGGHRPRGDGDAHGVVRRTCSWPPASPRR